MIRIESYHARKGGVGTWSPGMTTSAYRVSVSHGWAEVNTRICKLWRPDNRYPGFVTVRRHESGGLELSFDALLHGSKPRLPVVIAEEHVRKFILSCLDCGPNDPPEDVAA